MKKITLERGDYVLATKFMDGDPRDHFVVGFFRGEYYGRYLVEDGHGNLFRRNGFRRCERISRNCGAVLVDAMRIISDVQGKSLWYWKRHLKELRALLAVSDYSVGESGGVL